MRTLNVIAEMGSGGAEAVVADLASRQAAAGHDVAVASSGGWRARQLAGAGVPQIDVSLRDPGLLSLAGATRRLRREVGRRPVDLVHAHNVRATAAAAAAVGGRRTPLVTTVHGLAEEDYPRAARILRRCSRLVVAVSDDVSERLVAGGVPSTRVVVIENAVPGPAVVEPHAVRAELGVPEGAPLVLCVARLAPPKRVDLLVAAWAEVPDAVLLVVGDGPDRPALERAAGERILFVGDRDDVPRLLAAADLLVLPSDREGLPMSVLEAMAAGVPVVAHAVGGLPDVDPAAVALVPPGAAEPLAATVRDLLSDPARRNAQAALARSLVEQRFSSERMWHAYESVYLTLVDRGKGS